MSKKFSDLEKNTAVTKINTLVNKGMSATDAIKKVGIATSQYYAWKKTATNLAGLNTVTAKEDLALSKPVGTGTTFSMEVPIPAHILNAAVRQYLAQKLGLN